MKYLLGLFVASVVLGASQAKAELVRCWEDERSLCAYSVEIELKKPKFDHDWSTAYVRGGCKADRTFPVYATSYQNDMTNEPERRIFRAPYGIEDELVVTMESETRGRGTLALDGGFTAMNMSCVIEASAGPLPGDRR